MKSIKTITLAVSSLFLVPALAHGKELKPSQIGMAMMRLNASPFSNASQADQYPYSGSLWSNLRKDFKMNEVNQSLVREHESKFAANSAYFNRTLNRSRPYMYHITNEVKKRGMPAEIALLPFIESAYVTKAKSRVGASGLWQFMPATGRHYGLEQTSLYDGRHDVYAATDAALNYLQYLHGLFGDWSLALAAYNWGEGNVSRAIRKAEAAGLSPTYENLKMPNETRNYVPKLLAVRNLVSNPQIFGLSLPNLDHKPYFKTVMVDSPLDIAAAARLANISENEFLELNPAFKTPVFMPKASRKMLLPVSAVKSFEDNYKKTDAKSLLSWDVFTPNYAITLDDVAMQTGSSVEELKRLNNLRSNNLQAGRTILVSKNSAAGLNKISAALAKADFDPVPDTYVDQKPVSNQFTASSIGKRDALASSTPNAAKTSTIASASVAEPTKATVAAVEPSPDFVAGLANKTAGNKTAESKLTVEYATVADAVKTVAQAGRVEYKPQAAQTTNAAEVKPSAVQVASVEKNIATNVVKTNASALVAQKNTVAAGEAKTNALPTVQERFEPEADPLLALAKESQARIQASNRAAEAVRASMAQSDVEAKTAPEIKKAQVAVKSKVDGDRNDTHKVVEGDTLYSIAKRYNMNVADLVSENRLKGNSIRAGQVLKVATGKGTNSVQTVRVAGKNSSANRIPASYTVRKGDTLQTIAERYKLKVSEIQRLNKGKSNVKAGQTIKLTPS